jgi:multiple sugar transport system ATP-binding protein
MIYVTHDQSEAMTLADRIVVLNHGRIEQVGTPKELYHSPDNRFVAGFIGSPRMNFLPVQIASAKVTGPGGLVIDAGPEGQTIAEIGIRSEAIQLVNAGDGRMTCVLERIEDLGHEHFAYCRINGDVIWVIRVNVEPPRELIGTEVGLNFRDTAIFAFAADGKRLILNRQAGVIEGARQ